MQTSSQETSNKVNPDSLSYKPTNYKEMDEWLNALSRQDWIAVIGSYIAGGGNSGVVQHMRTKYKDTVAMWKDNDLQHFFSSRKWSDFRTRGERT